MLKARMTLTATVLVLLVFGSAAFWGNTPRDLLNLAIVLVTPPLIFWLIVRPTKARKQLKQSGRVRGKTQVDHNRPAGGRLSREERFPLPSIEHGETS